MADLNTPTGSKLKILFTGDMLNSVPDSFTFSFAPDFLADRGAGHAKIAGDLRLAVADGGQIAVDPLGPAPVSAFKNGFYGC